jgi:hypothetical protein
MVKNCLISNLKDNSISPKACNPVSEDVCKSGFMAPADKIILPEGLLEGVCCKCKNGKDCKYCVDKKNCSSELDIEMETSDKFITSTSLCFSDSEEFSYSGDDISDDLKEELEKKEDKREEEEEDMYEDLRYGEYESESIVENDNLFGINYWYILVPVVIAAACVTFLAVIKSKKNIRV